MRKTISQIGQKVAELFGETTPIDQGVSSGADINAPEEKNYIQTLLPYRTYDEKTGLFENSDSYGFIIESSPLLGADAYTEKELSHLAKEIGEESLSIQCLLWADHRIDRFLHLWSKKRNEQGGLFAKMAKQKRDFFYALSRDGTDTNRAPPRLFRFFLSVSLPKEGNEDAVARLCQKKEKALALLKRLSPAHLLDSDGFIDLLSGLVNFSLEPETRRRKRWDRGNYLSKQICLPGAIRDCEEHLVFASQGEEALFRSYEIIDEPDVWSLDQSSARIGDFHNISQQIFSPFYIHMGIHFPEQRKEETKMKTKDKMLDQHLKFPYIRKLFPKMPREKQEVQFALAQLGEGEKFVQVRTTIGLWDKKETLLNAESSLYSLYQKLGFKLQPNSYLHFDEFLHNLPLTWSNPRVLRQIKITRSTRTTLTTEVGRFIPMMAEWAGNTFEGMPLMGRRGQLCSWDPFCTHGNLNTTVIGPSGSGKSVFMQDVITNQLGQGGRVFILDLGRSFEKLCYLLDGQYLFFNALSNLNLNPFALLREEIAEEEKKAALDMVVSIVSTMAMPTKKISKEKADILAKAVHLAYQKKKKKATIDDVIIAISHENFSSELMRGSAESLIESLRKYTTDGSYKNYFYGAQHVDFQKELVVIETEELKNTPDLQAVVLQIFSLMIANEVFMGDRKKRALICIDEAWDLLKSPQMEGFIESMARRLRKYNGALMVGTQGIKDFDRSPGASAAFQNSNWLILLGRDSDSLHQLKEKQLIEVTPHVEECLNSLHKIDGEYGEAFIYNKGTGFYTVCRLKLDPFSNLLYSTKADDFQRLLHLKEQGYSIEDAILLLTSPKEKQHA